MFKIKNIIILSLVFFGNQGFAQTVKVQGNVSDHDGKPIETATVAIPELALGTLTDSDGVFQLSGIPNGTWQVSVSFLGYESFDAIISVNRKDVIMRDIALKTSNASSLNEVVVTGVSRATLIRENPLAMEVVSAKQIDQSTENNTIDAISKNAPGLQSVKTGPNISKPFINGLGYNRVLTLYDGLRVETQQWGDEHGVPMDDYIIERAEIIKGPASLLYGSDAIAGVLSLFPKIPKETDGLIHGRFLSEYQTNNGLIGNSLSITQGKKHWSWALRGSERVARNYDNPVDGRVYNTGFKMANASAFLGYHNEKGYSRLNITFYNNRQGIPDGSRDSLTRKFTYQVYESPGENSLLTQVDNIKDRPIAPNSVLNSYKINALTQRIQDYRIYNDNSFQLGQGNIKASMGFEQNIRREFDHPTEPAQAGEYIVLNSFDYGLRYNAPTVFNIEPSIGINGMYQTNTNKNATDFPIPDYHLFDMGAYTYGKWKRNCWTIAGGLRYDHRSETGEGMYIGTDSQTGFSMQEAAGDMGAIQQFTPFQLNFRGVSGSMGATYQFDGHISLKANVARGYRSPNITEIASNGLDPGAHIVYEGNLDFKSEFSLQEDVGLAGTYNNFSFTLTAFNNSIENFIYEDQKVDVKGNPIVVIPGNKTFQYQQTDARLYGMDATFNVHPENWESFHFDNAFSIVYGKNRNPKYKHAGSQGEYLPFMPPARWLSSIAYDIATGYNTIPSITVKVENDLNLAQNRYLGLYQTETGTAAYDLVDVSTNTGIHYGKGHVIQFTIAANNILNTAYQSHLSRLQYFEYYQSSPNGRQGIYNMGRNICMKIIVSF